MDHTPGGRQADDRQIPGSFGHDRSVARPQPGVSATLEDEADVAVENEATGLWF
jgi:hypothetical protein